MKTPKEILEEKLNKILDKEFYIRRTIQETLVKKILEMCFQDRDEFLKQKQDEINEQIRLHFKTTPLELQHRLLYIDELRKDLKNE